MNRKLANDRDGLLDVASSISDGTEVDWQNVPVTDDTTAIVAQLQIVEQIARLHGASRAWESLQTRETIGRGAHGVVYRAFDPDLEREVALKVVQFDGANETAAELAVKEARLLARVKNPHVVTVFRAERHGFELGLWLELIEGVTLADLVQRQGPLSAREATLVGLDICSALAAIHGAGLIHSDIKAHNVMREHGGRIVLMDFGAARDLSRTHDPVAGDFAGTPLYVAPEVFLGKPRSKASDIYSVGVLLYYIVTGTYPVEGSSKTEIGRRHERGRPQKRLRDVRSDLPLAFVQVVERALVEDPEQRYQSAGELEAALASALPPSSRMRHVLMAAAVLAGIALTGTAWVAWRDTATIAPTSAGSGVSAPSTPTASSYQISAALYRARDGGDERLAPGARVEPGDRLFFRLESSVPAYVYIVNEDERGDSYLLFPLPGQNLSQPLLPTQSHELPGLRDGKPFHWVVTSTGGREHFLVFANPERLTLLEQIFANLPAPAVGQTVTNRPLSREAIGVLRGVGGLTPAPMPANASMSLASQFTTPLSDGPETANGLWVRRMTLENPAGK